MDAMLWLLSAVFVFILLIGVGLIVFVKKKGKIETDYYTLFTIGIIWFAVGLPLKNYVLSAVGVVLFILGLVNKDKWKKNELEWHKMSSKDKKKLIWMMVALGIIVLAGVLVFFMWA